MKSREPNGAGGLGVPAMVLVVLPAGAVSPLGFVAASLEEFAEQLAAPEHNRGLALTFAQVETEAKILCQRLVDRAIEARRTLLLVSPHHTTHEWRELATPLARAGYLVIFRNDAPLDGSEVHVLS